jgi:hypothetical protein
MFCDKLKNRPDCLEGKRYYIGLKLKCPVYNMGGICAYLGEHILHACGEIGVIHCA